MLDCLKLHYRKATCSMHLLLASRYVSSQHRWLWVAAAKSTSLPKRSEEKKMSNPIYRFVWFNCRVRHPENRFIESEKFISSCKGDESNHGMEKSHKTHLDIADLALSILHTARLSCMYIAAREHATDSPVYSAAFASASPCLCCRVDPISASSSTKPFVRIWTRATEKYQTVF